MRARVRTTKNADVNMTVLTVTLWPRITTRVEADMNSSNVGLPVETPHTRGQLPQMYVEENNCARFKMAFQSGDTNE